jgi:hypothetical protein
MAGLRDLFGHRFQQALPRFQIIDAGAQRHPHFEPRLEAIANAWSARENTAPPRPPPTAFSLSLTSMVIRTSPYSDMETTDMPKARTMGTSLILSSLSRVPSGKKPSHLLILESPGDKWSKGDLTGGGFYHAI